MPSSNKTLNLELNKWIGSDKPKKDDFNADNQKLDTAIKQLSDQLGQLSQSQQSGHLSNAQAVSSLGTSLSTHVENAAVHVTAAEKALWNAPSGGGFTIGAYVGDGNLSRTVSPGFCPRFGIIFPAAQLSSRVSFASSQILMYSGFMSGLGCTEGVELISDGFRVYNGNNVMEAYAIRLNTASQTYVYVVWE